MAAAAHVTALVYGFIEGNPPFGNTNTLYPSRVVNYDTPVTMSFPTTGTIFHPVSPGIPAIGAGNFIYSIIEVQPTGLNNHGQKYSSGLSVATLATNAG